MHKIQQQWQKKSISDTAERQQQRHKQYCPTFIITNITSSTTSRPRDTSSSSAWNENIMKENTPDDNRVTTGRTGNKLMTKNENNDNERHELLP